MLVKNGIKYWRMLTQFYTSKTFLYGQVNPEENFWYLVKYIYKKRNLITYYIVTLLKWGNNTNMFSAF